MRERRLDNKKIMKIAFIVFIALILIWAIIGFFQQKRNMYEYTLDKGWDAYVNGNELALDARLSDLNFGELSRGATIDLYVDLPAQLNGGYTIELLVYLCSVEAYVDDKMIYDYALDSVTKDIMIGSGYHFINLPEDITGKTLHIRTVMNERDAYTSIPTPKCVKTSVDQLAFANYQLVNAWIGIFVMGLGFVLTLVSIFATLYNRIYKRLVYIGLFANLMGCWSLMNNKVCQVFSNNYIANTTFEYLCIYLAPIPFALLMYDMRSSDNSWRRTICKVVCTALIIFGVASPILHYTNTVRFPEILPVFHVIILTSVVALALAGYITVKHKTASETITAVAMILVIGVIALDICRFNIQKYIFPNYGMLMNSFIPLGTLVFVIMLLVSYLSYLYDMVMTKTEKETLTRLAYHDQLTGLYNRTKYEEDLTSLDENGKDFAIVSFDVNDLKQVNDTYGHSRGDLLLTSFSNIILRNFADLGTCYRIGGDEYVVIVDAANLSKITNALVNLTMDEKDKSKELEFTLTSSYGVAYRSEIKNNEAYGVYRIADQRMYAMKSETKGKEYVFAGVKASVIE